MIEALRNGTRVAHQALDQMLIPVIRRIRTHNDYVELLVLFYGYLKPMQDGIDKHLNDGLIMDYSLRRRPERLLDDINSISGYAGRIILCQRLPAIRNIDEALGAYYVLEGSTLGGSVISQMIKESLKVTNERGLSFFMGYGGNNRKMWDNFVKSLEEITAGSPDSTHIIESARKTFECFKNWLIECYERKGNRKLP